MFIAGEFQSNIGSDIQLGIGFLNFVQSKYTEEYEYVQGRCREGYSIMFKAKIRKDTHMFSEQI